MVAEMIVVFLRKDGRESGPTVVGEAVSGEEGLVLFRKYRPSLVISALDLGDMTGTEMLTQMRTEVSSIQTLVCTGTKKIDLIYAALEFEPQGFVHKSEGLIILGEAVSRIIQGSGYLSPYAMKMVNQRRLAPKSGRSLTVAERRLVQMIAEGLSTKQIAARLHLSPKTVENYRKQVMSKLGLSGIAPLTRYAIFNGILE